MYDFTGRDKIRCEIITTILRSCELNELNSTPLVNAGIVTPLLLFLQKGSVEMIQVTVKLLAELSSVEQNKVLIAKAGAIPVRRLRSSFPVACARHSFDLPCRSIPSRPAGPRPGFPIVYIAFCFGL